VSEREFYIVDVFAERPATGNQLAVVIARGDEAADEMQAIAREFNFSETTFVTHVRGDVRVRIFTPLEEVAFAGHPTLGTSWIVRHRISGGSMSDDWGREARGEIVLCENVGPIPTWVTGNGGREIVWMRQNPAILIMAE